MADTTAKLNILVQLKDEASSAMRSIGNNLSEVGGQLGFAGDKAGLLVGAFAALGGMLIGKSVSAFDDANLKLITTQSLLKTLPGGMKLYERSLAEGNKAASQFGFDNEQVTLSLARFLAATKGDVPHAMQALQAAMGLAIEKFDGPGGMASATDLVMRAFAGGGRILKEFGEKIGDNESAMSAIAKVAQHTVPYLDAWGQSSQRNSAVVKELGNDILENMGKPIAEARDWLLKFITSSNDTQSAIEKLKDVFGSLGILLSGGVAAGFVLALPKVISLAGGFLGLGESAGVLATALGAVTGTIGLWVIAIAAAIAIGYLIYKNWDEIKVQLVATWELIKMKAEQIWDAIVKFFKNLPETMGQIFGELVVTVIKWMQGLYDFFTKTIPATIQQLVDWFAALPGRVVDAISSMPRRVVEIFQNAAQNIKSIFQDVVNFIANAPGAIVDFGKNAINSFIDIVNRFVKGFNSVAGKVGINLPEIPKFAEGGIVTRPTLGILGEAGAEAVIPLNRLQGRGIGGGGITINIQGDFYTTREVAEKFANEIARLINYQIKLA